LTHFLGWVVRDMLAVDGSVYGGKRAL
jgi:hypothetical protein